MVKEKEVEHFKIVEVPTATTRLYETPSGEKVGFDELLVHIANGIEELKRRV